MTNGAKENKETVQRAELHRKIWAIADDVRGSAGGEFFTPQSVSKLLARLVMDGKTSINKAYDPTCGSRVIMRCRQIRS